MYLPKHQFIVIPTAEAPILVDVNGEEYNKPTVVKTSANEYYDIPQQELEFGDFTNAILLQKKEVITTPELPTLPKPTEKDYKAGVLNRYFLQNTSTGKILEISKELYDIKFKNKPLYEKVAKLEWKLEGPVNDIVVGGNVFRGASNVNRDSVKELSKTIKGIENLVTDYSQFIKETPADRLQVKKLKQVKTSFDIPSPSKKL